MQWLSLLSKEPVSLARQTFQIYLALTSLKTLWIVQSELEATGLAGHRYSSCDWVDSACHFRSWTTKEQLFTPFLPLLDLNIMRPAGHSASLSNRLWLSLTAAKPQLMMTSRRLCSLLKITVLLYDAFSQIKRIQFDWRILIWGHHCLFPWYECAIGFARLLLHQKPVCSMKTSKIKALKLIH